MAQENKEERPILIVSDDAEEARVVRELLQRDFANLTSADNEVAGLRLFEENRPAVLVLAFQEMTKSERFYLMLYRHCPDIRAIRHQTLLLCKSNESEAAFSLCRKDTFDDYLVNRPLHDPYQLRLAVQQAMSRQAGCSESETVQRQLSDVGIDLRQLDAFVKQALEGGQARQAGSIRAFRDFASRLTRELDQFEAHIGEAAQGQAANIIDNSGLRQHFDELRRDRIAPEVQQVDGKLQEAQQWAQKIDREYREQAARITGHEVLQTQPEVMLVDDDEVYREMLGIMLEEVGLRLVHAADGEAALAAMHIRRPDIVLLDYKMPGLNGVALLKRMKSDAALSQIPVIMLTAVNTREIIQEMKLAGASSYILKPSNRPTIIAKINSLLARVR